MSALVAGLHVSAVPAHVPPPAAFAASGSTVFSVTTLNENTPPGAEPRTQNETPLYADAFAQVIQMPPPMPQFFVCITVCPTAYTLGG
jgi:hypothetical protein